MQKEFDWDKFKNESNKIAVHCRTLEEAKDFCRKMHEHGMKWRDGGSYLKKIFYGDYKDRTCYTGIGSFDCFEYFIEEHYKILEWSDYMQKDFTKLDLKNGMVVEYRNGKIGIYINGKILYEDGFDVIDELTDDLLDADCEDCNKGYDIIKVYELNMSGIYNLKTVLEKKNLILIWERNETKHMTAEEMRVKLEEMTGEKIEIEPSKEEMVGIIEIYCRNHRCGNCSIRKECDNKNSVFCKCDLKFIKQCYKKVMVDERRSKTSN